MVAAELRNEDKHQTTAHPGGLPPGRPLQSKGMFNDNK